MASFSPNELAEILLDVEQMGKVGGCLNTSAKEFHDLVAGLCREQGDLYGKLCQPVSVLGLSMRASNCLEFADDWCSLGEGNAIDKVFQLVARSQKELLSIRNLGPKTLQEIQSKLLQVTGLSLKGVKKLEVQAKDIGVCP